MKCHRLDLSWFGGTMIFALVIPVVFAEDGSKPAEQVTAEAGWTFRVAANNLAQIDNLAMDDDGSLYATQELPFGTGKVIRWDRGEITTVVSGLNRPDGLLRHGRKLFIAEETSKGRLLEYDLSSRKLRVLAVLNHPEGIDILPDGDLVVSENIMKGRLLRVSRTGGKSVEVILDDLKRPEGVLVRPDGAIVFAETATGRVLSYQNGEVNVVVDDLSEPDQVELAPEGSLWITEDASDGRMLRLQDGTLEIVLNGLRYPQGMAFGADGSVWLAEQGRQRILVVRPLDSP